ncbi:O-fucosyltransferase 38 [Olea europaea subsp. europaea]|uniref:O-fucosyltransferase family protein n=1 Tax=Olea europaea subsp. europaea TaxID=158383 RepID=A0A8S0VAH3_OLEEU|nr:O-fucosyltransferase 38 [Olea europaea subsp. europaea]
MLSFTGCTYGLTDAESEELRIMREKTNHWKTKNINSTEQRIGGFCHLTPKEVGVFLQALGYPPSTLIYIAAGEIYGGNAHLSELTSRYPNVVSRLEMLATFSKHAFQTAALDYIISIESDVFIPSHSGNMARAVEGHRRFLGHRRTITPDRQGAPRKREGAPPGIKGRARFKLEESFYQNPYPECICRSKDTARCTAKKRRCPTRDKGSSTIQAGGIFLSEPIPGMYMQVQRHGNMTKVSIRRMYRKLILLHLTLLWHIPEFRDMSNRID